MVKKSKHSESTEDKILEAAKKVFVRNGLDGATMQQIADEAGINKSLLHYYFRTKQKLFGTVLKFAFKFIVPQLQDILTSPDPIFIKIERLVSEYIDLLLKNSHIPAFVLHEINRNPDSIVQIMKDAGINPKLLFNPLLEDIRKGNIRPIDPRHLIINILSLCVFPIIARPLAQRVFFENNENAYKLFLEERKKEVSDFIIASIKA
jgi:TetR/AcrR family transcriptional regulator